MSDSLAVRRVDKGTVLLKVLKYTLTFRHDRYRYHQTVRSIPYDFISQGKTRVSRLMLGKH